jgi:hypothetical protein
LPTTSCVIAVRSVDLSTIHPIVFDDLLRKFAGT